MITTYLSQEFLAYPISFLFVFAVIFGVLELVNKRQKGGFFPRKVNILIAITFGLVAMAYEPLLSFIWSIIPLATVILVVLFFIAFLGELFKQSEEKEFTVIIIVLGILLLIMGALWDKIAKILPFQFMNQSDLLWIIGIIIVLLMFYAAYMSQKESRVQSKELKVVKYCPNY